MDIGEVSILVELSTPGAASERISELDKKVANSADSILGRSNPLQLPPLTSRVQPHQQTAYHEVTRRATDEEKMQIESKLALLPDKENQIAALQEALKAGEWDGKIFDSADYPYYALEALKCGGLTQEEFATAQIFWQIQQLHDKAAIQFVPFFNGGGTADSNVKDFVREMCKNNYLGIDILSEAQIDELFEKLKGFPKSQQGLWIVSDTVKDPEGRVLFSRISRYSNLTIFKNIPRNENTPESVKNLFFKNRDVIKTVPSLGLMQAFLDVKYGDKAVKLNPILGLSSDEDIRRNGLEDTRDIALRHPGVSLPRTADGFDAPGYEFGVYHDYGHAATCSQIKGDLRRIAIQLADFVAERIESGCFTTTDIAILDRIRGFLHDMLFTDDWSGLAGLFVFARTGGSISPPVREVLRQCVKMVAAYPAFKDGPAKAYDSALKDLERTVEICKDKKENDELLIDNAEGVVAILKVMVIFWNRSKL